ncbi:lipoate--protein ligase [Sodalis-like endosymbiont of Proechinophthirus fluctus]|uniref:lipoyl(octanoyl) transferase LipB n=1 Tax=Sodalis-like endosymbiont of Proechinophthirus fluctus TaxID=1462730 RepID=UPI0007A849E5|nr:lipoyl(octanoyl) transferase LipB [Sodalis-like endosymbiont of Proechinophthirus fluctus]KYP96310.1 lipoate--protein ligase [Sodalis-like endosymbiont of Proechinophthirus fluctus]
MIVSESLVIRQLGLQPYERVSRAMNCFTNDRNTASTDEIWLVQHPQVFTQGQAGKVEHLLQPGTIPVIQSDRGGQVTFHGPGQQVMYVLLDLRRRRLGVRDLITLLERTVIATLAGFAISAHARADAPGVYVGANKICSLGLRIRKGCCFHGLALNVAMDLSPFLRINPCGHAGLRMTQVSDLSPGTGIDDVAPVLLAQCLQLLDATVGEMQGWDPAQYGA